MIFESLLILAMTLHGEIDYRKKIDHFREAQLIQATANNRAKVCETSAIVELLKNSQFSCQNGKGVVITKYNMAILARRLYDAFRVINNPIVNNDVLYYHADWLLLSKTGQAVSKMKMEEHAGNHIFYSSNDFSFCRARSDENVELKNVTDTDSIKLCVDNSVVNNTEFVKSEKIEPIKVIDYDGLNEQSIDKPAENKKEIKVDKLPENSILDKNISSSLTVEQLRNELNSRLFH